MSPSKKNPFIASCIYFLCLAFLLELTVRVYMRYAYGIGFLRPREAICKYYPRMLSLMQSKVLPENGTFDILILGGSTVNRRISHIEDILYKELTSRYHAMIFLQILS